MMNASCNLTNCNGMCGICTPRQAAPQPCPSCGHCPTCGHTPPRLAPYPYYPSPWWGVTPPTPWWITTTGASTFTVSASSATMDDLTPYPVSNEALAKWGRSMTGGDTSEMLDT